MIGLFESRKSAMNHKHLFYFWKVAKLGSVRKAAAAINITPQTLSGQIGLLEESLGTELFGRRGRSIVLTDAGKLALEYANELFALSAELEVVIKHLPGGGQPSSRWASPMPYPSPWRARCCSRRSWASRARASSVANGAWTDSSAGGALRSISCWPTAWFPQYRRSRLQPPLASIRGSASWPRPASRSNRRGISRLLGTLPLLLPGEGCPCALRPQRLAEKSGFGRASSANSTTARSWAPSAARGSVPSRSHGGRARVSRYGRPGRSRPYPGGSGQFYAISVERRLTHPCVVAIAFGAADRHATGPA